MTFACCQFAVVSIQQMMMANPQMRAIIDQNPQLAHVLNDPQVLRQSMEIARNPEL